MRHVSLASGEFDAVPGNVSPASPESAYGERTRSAEFPHFIKYLRAADTASIFHGWRRAKRDTME